ncbi:hypothetical protein I547_0309 [Mycobacterium kansasii 824]|nr:hypothetical protein I547_0309 [Mycobacterium kansasii 824]
MLGRCRTRRGRFGRNIIERMSNERSETAGDFRPYGGGGGRADALATWLRR